MNEFRISRPCAEVSFEEASTRLKPEVNLLESLETVVTEVNRLIEPIGGFRIFDEVMIEEERIIVGETVFLCHRKIARLLTGTTQLAILVCTLGEAVSELYAKYSTEYNFVNAYLCDRVANMAIEKAVNEVKGSIRLLAEQNQQKVTSQISPGYCNWAIEDQKKLFTLLPSEPCGISLTSSYLMQPMKSVSAVMGIGEEVKYKESDCRFCHLRKCIYRRSE